MHSIGSTLHRVVLIALAACLHAILSQPALGAPSTPILNPPQSGVLGLHRVEDRPVVKNGQIVIRPMMYLALSYDHRLIDGREAVTFLVRVKEAIEDPARLLIDL